MSLNRFGKSGDRGPTLSYRDRTAYAVDAQLASLASAGDDSAFTTLVTRFQPAVFRWALMFAGDPDEAEDITQEVFVRTYRELGQYRSDGPLDAWLYRITRRAATQMRRTRKRRGRLALSPAAKPLRDVYTTDPGGRVDRERAASVIRELFAELPRRQREISLIPISTRVAAVTMFPSPASRLSRCEAPRRSWRSPEISSGISRTIRPQLVATRLRIC
jgi:RNA polymerase sigma factor (sigma-70 family)